MTVDGIGKLARLAAPMAISRIGMQAMPFIASAAAATHGRDDLSAFALAMAPMQVFQLLGLSMVTGTQIQAARAKAQGDQEGVHRSFRQGLTACAILFVGAVAAIPFVKSDLFVQLVLGLPFVYGFATVGALLEGLRRPRFAMVATVAGLLVQCSTLFLASASLSLTIARFAMFAVAACGLTAGGGFRLKELLPRGPSDLPDRAYLTVGAPMTLSFALSSTAFMTLTYLARSHGPLAVGTLQLALSVAGLFLMPANAIGNASAIGLIQARRPRFALGLDALSLTTIVLVVLSFGGIAATSLGIHALIKDPQLAVALVQLVPALIVYVSLDSYQMTLSGLLRGSGDSVFPPVLRGTVLWLVAIPLNFFGVSPLPALALATVSVALWMAGRWWYCGSREETDLPPGPSDRSSNRRLLQGRLGVADE